MYTSVYISSGVHDTVLDHDQREAIFLRTSWTSKTSYTCIVFHLVCMCNPQFIFPLTTENKNGFMQCLCWNHESVWWEVQEGCCLLHVAPMVCLFEDHLWREAEGRVRCPTYAEEGAVRAEAKVNL